MPQVAAVVVAAGQGLRAGGDMPKQFREIGGASLLRRSLLGFASVPAVSALQPVVRKDDIDLVREHTRDIRILPPVFGGATRQASVRAGLEALSSRSPDIVLVHDAARSPCFPTRHEHAWRLNRTRMRESPHPIFAVVPVGACRPHAAARFGRSGRFEFAHPLGYC